MEIDNFLLKNIKEIPKINQKKVELVKELVGGDKIFHLLFFKALYYQNIKFDINFNINTDINSNLDPKINSNINSKFNFEQKFEQRELVILKVKIQSISKIGGSSYKLGGAKINCVSKFGIINILYFKVFPNQLDKFVIGKEIYVYGYLERKMNDLSDAFNSRLNMIEHRILGQIIHPIKIYELDDDLPKTNIVYHLKANLSQNFISDLIQKALIYVKDIDFEWIDNNLIVENKWLKFIKSIKIIHDNKDTEVKAKALKRLAYDELLAWQIAIILSRKFSSKLKESKQIDERKIENFINTLPFELTNSQKNAIKEIKQDLLSSKIMLRILQGDVGSGKTVVAIAASYVKILQGKQVCILVPISLLAKQHFKYFSNILCNEKIDILTSETKAKERSAILKRLEDGETNIIIGTHALIEDDIIFKNLGLVVIDEQHRFGVNQRMRMVKKGEEVDSLLMSATPIPRSLMMTLFGDIDLTIINEKPKNRIEIETLVISKKNIHKIYDSLLRAIEKNEKIYWICPAIDDQEFEVSSCDYEEIQDKKEVNKSGVVKKQLTSVYERYEELCKIIDKDKIAVIHGKLKPREKTEIMQNFIENDSVNILIATTVIEVGIDFKDASIIIIENAENYGLAQLHQLRGRVGRGDKKSYCILLYTGNLSQNSKKRLEILKDSNDGFEISKRDYELRGGGEIIGLKQSGIPNFRIANLEQDSEILMIANKQAKYIINRYFEIKDEAQNDKKNDENKIEEITKIKFLLRLFGYEECTDNKSINLI